MRRALFVLSAAATLLAPPAAAQRVYFGASGDTAIGIVPGTETLMPIRSVNPYGYYYPVQQVQLTFVFDPARLSVTGFTPSGMSYNFSTSSGSGTFTLSANGYAYGYDTELFQLRLRLAPGVTDGAWIHVRVDSYSIYAIGNYANSMVGGIGQVCHASVQLGDIDGAGGVTSRDALIALSAAVGLPVSGYDLTRGDVDGDGLTNSRDALMILNYSVALNYWYGNNMTGRGIPDACQGLVAPIDDIVLRIRDTVAGVDTIGLLAAGTTTPVAIPGASGNVSFPRLAADGQRVVYQCLDGFGYAQVCRIRTDGSAFAMFTSGFTSSNQPDWNAAGTLIVFRNTTNGVMRVDSGGANPVQISSSTSGFSAVFDRAPGAQPQTVAYVDGVDVRTIGADSGTGGALIASAFINPHQLRYAPAGDTIAMTLTSTAGLWTVPATGGAPARIASFAIAGAPGLLGFDWGAPGLVFASEEAGREGLWLMAGTNGPLVRLTRGKHVQPAFRRSP